MTKPRRKPKTTYHAFLVKPAPGFVPSNWKQTPDYYKVLQYLGPKHFKGQADAWRFLHNHEKQNHASIDVWAIYLDGATVQTDDTTTPPSNPALLALTRNNLTATPSRI
ncbi:MAG: hypothetical protein OSA89_02810 [Mariniblastus sp.]|nr:hypothetical protein [Mariniblastus sp.]